MLVNIINHKICVFIQFQFIYMKFVKKLICVRNGVSTQNKTVPLPNKQLKHGEI